MDDDLIADRFRQSVETDLLNYPPETHPETNKYLRYLLAQINCGLKFVSYFTSDAFREGKADIEELCAELNRMVEAPSIPNPRL